MLFAEFYDDELRWRETFSHMRFSDYIGLRKVMKGLKADFFRALNQRISPKLNLNSGRTSSPLTYSGFSRRSTVRPGR